MPDERLIFLPLGGAGEIGMNAYVYGYGRPGHERLILVDLGITFPDMDTTPGVDVIMADIDWLAERRDRLDAIFITHAHEDHVGALGHLWPRLRAPVHARTFTAAIARLKLEEAGLPTDAVRVADARPAVVEAGPFQVQFAPVSHSVPESAALIIDTPLGRIIHSGDFKIDRSPVVGEAWDDDMWEEIAEEAPVHALMCDSTNVFSTHEGRSESVLADPIAGLIAKAPGLFVATTFSSNVARLKTLAEAGAATGRKVCILGRSMRRMLRVARETGVLHDFPETVSVDEALDLPREELLLLVTGSQGERRAASAALSRGKYLGFELGRDDTFLFSSRVIPGNERAVIGIWNRFSAKGVRVVDYEDGRYHVSGHANRPDLEHVHRLLRPAAVIPMHGEHRHLAEHARIAARRSRKSLVVTNGMLVDLGGKVPVVTDHVETGRVYLDGSVLIGALDGVVRERIHLALNGHAVATLILDDKDEPLGEPWVDLAGLAGTRGNGADLQEVMERDLADWLDRAKPATLRDDERIESEIRRLLRQTAVREIGKKPEVTVIVSRLYEDDE